MAKAEVRVLRQKIRKIKNQNLKELNGKKAEKEKKRKNEHEEGIEETEREAVQEKEESNFEFADELSQEKKAPLLGRGRQGEELETKLEGIKGKEKEEEKGDELKYSFEKPKYSFSDEKESE